MASWRGPREYTSRVFVWSSQGLGIEADVLGLLEPLVRAVVLPELREGLGELRMEPELAS